MRLFMLLVVIKTDTVILEKNLVILRSINIGGLKLFLVRGTKYVKIFAFLNSQSSRKMNPQMQLKSKIEISQMGTDKCFREKKGRKGVSGDQRKGEPLQFCIWWLGKT
jgi:hypothetical protein